MKKKDCTLLISSCDAYEDILDTFFLLLKKYWNDIKYNIVLSTETLDYNCKYFNIINVHPDNPNCTWTERITDALYKISDDYVILMLDDFFLFDFVKNEKIENCLDALKKNKRIASFTFWPIYSELKSCKYDGFGQRVSSCRFKVAAIAGIWNKRKLLKYTKNYKENIWQWEMNATERSNKFFNRDLFYVMLDDQSNIMPYDLSKYGLFSGKWMEGTKKLFKDNNIKFDFSKRGFYHEYERALCKSITDAFSMESAVICYYGLRKHGPSYVKCKKKFFQGNFVQNYNIKGAKNIICWEPSVLWGFAINNLVIQVYYCDKTVEAIKSENLFGTFAKLDDVYVFNDVSPTVYIPTAKNKKIKKVSICGNIFFLDDQYLLKKTYKKNTILENEYYRKLEYYINLEKLCIREKTYYINIHPEIKFYRKEKCIKDFVDTKISKKGNFEYRYQVPKHSEYILWSPSFVAGYMIKKMRIKYKSYGKKISAVESKKIYGIPSQNIYLDRKWIKIELPNDASEIIITGKCVFPIKNRILRKKVNNEQTKSNGRCRNKTRDN